MFISMFNAVVDRFVDWLIPLDTFIFEFDDDEV